MKQSTREHFKRELGRLDQSRPIVKQIAALVDLNANLAASAAGSIAGLDKTHNWKHLNDEGKRAAKRQALANPLREHFQSERSIEALKAQIKIPSLPDREASDLGGHIRDMEALRIVREMSQEKRERLSDLSPAFLAAVVRHPAEFSGVSPAAHDMIRSQLTEAMFPKEVAGARQDQEALNMTKDVLREARTSLRELGEFAHDTEFQQFAKQVVPPEQPVAKPQDIEPDFDKDFSAWVDWTLKKYRK